MDWMSMIGGLLNSGSGTTGSLGGTTGGANDMGGLMSGMGGMGVGSDSGGTSGGMMAMNPDFAAGMKSGAPSGGAGINSSPGATSKYAAPTEAQDMELGMSALKHYKDMSQYGDMNSLMGTAGNMQSLSSNAMNPKRPQVGQAYQNPYLTGLMGF